MWITNSHEAEIFLIFANVHGMLFCMSVTLTSHCTGGPQHWIQGYYLLPCSKEPGNSNSEEGGEAWHQGLIYMHAQLR